MRKIMKFALTMCVIAGVGAVAGSCNGNDKIEPTIETYSITIASADEGGQGVAKLNGEVVAEAKAGETITISAIADNDFAFSEWTVEEGDADLVSATASETTFTMPESDVIIKPSFESTLEYYTLTFPEVTGGRGEARLDSDEVITQAAAGETITISAIADTDFAFTKWSVEEGDAIIVNATASETTFTMPEGNVTIKPSFETTLDYYTITFPNVPGGKIEATIDGEPVTKALEGATVSIKAIADENRYFDYWLIKEPLNDVVIDPALISLGDKFASETTFIMPPMTVSLECMFQISQYDIAIANDGNGKVAINGEVSAGRSFRVGQDVRLVATPNTGYIFKEWVEIEGITIDAVKASAEFEMPANKVSMKATFEPEPVVDVDWVQIGNLKWAKYNVGEPKTFVENSEDAGMFYQWGRGNKGYPATGDVSGWDSSHAPGSEWPLADQPCPEGYKVASEGDFNALWASTNRTSATGGHLFTDKETNATIFFPAAGRRSYSNGSLSFVGSGYYWTSTGGSTSNNARQATTHEGRVGNNSRSMGSLIRCILIE